jgi:hypothetical protein
MSIDMNKFNTLINEASDAIMCNSECRKTRDADKLKERYLKAKTNLAYAPNILQQAEKKYVIFTEGQSAYDDLRENQLQDKAKNIVSKFKETFQEEVSKVISQLETYVGLQINYNNVLDLYKTYKKENVQLFKKFKEDANDVLTNERKTYYEDQQIDGLKFYYYYVLLVIYIICVICYAVFSLIYPSQSSLAKKIGILIALIILPFISHFILGAIIYLVYEAYNLLPKNVYKEKDY